MSDQILTPTDVQRVARLLRAYARGGKGYGKNTIQRNWVVISRKDCEKIADMLDPSRAWQP